MSFRGVRLSRAVCSTMFHPAVPAGRVGVPTLYSHAVFIETKTEARVFVRVLSSVVKAWITM